MDFITHSLVGAGVARLACSKKEWRPQLTLAGLLGSLLMDGDSWLFCFGLSAYGRYHRVLSHNIFALGMLAVASAAIGRGAGRVENWRRFGWFAAPNIPEIEPLPTRPPWGRMLAVAIIAAALHWTYDYITAFGNMRPFWPLNSREVSLCAVNSFDYRILGLTLLWHASIRNLDWPRRKEAWITAGYFLIIVFYVTAMKLWGPKPYI